MSLGKVSDTVVGTPDQDQGQQVWGCSPGMGASPDSTLGGSTPEEPVSLILASSFSMMSAVIWSACQLNRVPSNNDNDNDNDNHSSRRATTRKNNTVGGDLQGLWIASQEGRGALRWKRD